MAFAVFAPFQPEFGTFVCGMRVYMSGVEIIEIRGIYGVFRYWGGVIAFVSGEACAT